MRAILISSLILTGCTSHIKSEWDCPLKTGLGCVTIDEADRHANIQINPSKTTPPSQEVKLNKKYNIHFKEYIDQQGNIHEASTVRISKNAQ